MVQHAVETAGHVIPMDRKMPSTVLEYHDLDPPEGEVGRVGEEEEEGDGGGERLGADLLERGSEEELYDEDRLEYTSRWRQD